MEVDKSITDDIRKKGVHDYGGSLSAFMDKILELLFTPQFFTFEAAPLDREA